jgi:hypothetical protein
LARVVWRAGDRGYLPVFSSLAKNPAWDLSMWIFAPIAGLAIVLGANDLDAVVWCFPVLAGLGALTMSVRRGGGSFQSMALGLLTVGASALWLIPWAAAIFSLDMLLQ